MLELTAWLVPGFDIRGFGWAMAGALVLSVISFFTKTRPMIARFSYAEKLEYWAMIWGTIVMAVTGLMLWFSVAVTVFLPRWWVDVALTIHLYEAILATLAVIVWHFYHVIFDPDVYPMSFVWLDGKMTPEQYEHEHGLAAQQEQVKPAQSEEHE